MGNVGQSMSVQPLLPIGENTLGKDIMQIHRYVFLPILRIGKKLDNLAIFNHATFIQPISI